MNRRRRDRYLRHCAALIGAALLAMASAGCAPRKPLDAWRTSVEHYITERGGGDPAALRELTALRSPHAPRPARIEVGEVNVPGTGGRMRDVQAVLAGVVTVGEHTWYLFVVGVVELDQGSARRVSDVRVAGLCVENGAMRWRFGPRDRYALRHYLATRRDTSFGARSFPGVTDAFTVEVGRRLVMVNEQTSGSTWVVDLDDEESPRDLNPFN